jgi:sodium/proline symporter
MIYAGMVLLGLCGRVLVRDLADPEQVFFKGATVLLPPVTAGMMIAAVLSAIMSTVDSQLLVCASSVTHDSSLNMKGLNPSRRLLYSRLTVLMITVLAVWMALRVTEAIFSRVLFAWNALGSAFGPLVLVRMLGKPIRPGFTLAAMLTGFTGTIILSTFPNAPGDIAERYIPFLLALFLSWLGRVRRKGII